MLLSDGSQGCGLCGRPKNCILSCPPLPVRSSRRELPAPSLSTFAGASWQPSAEQAAKPLYHCEIRCPEVQCFLYILLIGRGNCQISFASFIIGHLPRSYKEKKTGNLPAINTHTCDTKRGLSLDTRGCKTCGSEFGQKIRPEL